MRCILLISVCLVAGCPGPNAMGGSFSGNNCLAAPATLTSLVVASHFTGIPVAVGDHWTPGSGGQGLKMSEFELDIAGDVVPPCVQVHAQAENAVLDGSMYVTADGAGKGQIHVFIGPVDDSYSIDAEVAGLSAHVVISNNTVTFVR